MILVQKINIEWRQNFALIKRSKMPPLVDLPAKILRMRSRFSALFPLRLDATDVHAQCLILGEIYFR